MNFSEILHKAMELSTSKRYLTVYGIILAFLEFFIGWSIYVYEIIWAYNIYGRGHYTITQKEIFWFFDFVLRHLSSSIYIIIFILILLLLYIIIPPFLIGSIIGSIYRIHNEQPNEISESIALGFKHYTNILKFELMMSFASVPKILFLSFALYRFLGTKFSGLVYTIMAVFIIIVVLINILTIYTPYYIIMKNESLFSAISKSIHTVIMYIKDSIFIFFLSTVVILRVTLNIILFLILPIALGALFIYLSKFGFWIGFSISIFMGILSIIITLFIFGRFLVFSFAFWVLSLLAIEKKDEIYKLLNSGNSTSS